MPSPSWRRSRTIGDGVQYVITTCDYAPGTLGGAGVITDIRAVNIPPSPYVLLDEATRNLRVPLPQQHLSPSIAVAHLVGLPEWLAVDPDTRSPPPTPPPPSKASPSPSPPGRCRAPGRSATVTLFTCPGPGTLWTRRVRDDAMPPCGYVYQWSSTATHFTLTVDQAQAVVTNGYGN